MTDEETKAQALAWERELATITQIVRARHPGAPDRDVEQEAMGILLLATLPDAHLLDAVAMLRHDLERRGLTKYARLSIVCAGDVETYEEGKRHTVVGALLTGTHAEARKMASGIYETVTVEIPVKS